MSIKPSNTELFWNHRYEKSSTRLPNEEDPMLLAAIEYFGEIKGSRLLDLGCGNGASSLFFAKLGAEVTAIDISAVAIENLTYSCQANSINNISAIRCSAFEISSLPPFDFIFGNMILHHLEPFDKFAQVLRDSLVIGGKAYFRENNAASNLLIWFRENLVGKFGIPKGGDDEEFPLTPGEVRTLKKYLRVEIVYPEMLFFRLASQYLLKGKLKLLTSQLDRYLFQFPGLRRYSYRQNLLLSRLA